MWCSQRGHPFYSNTGTLWLSLKLLSWVASNKIKVNSVVLNAMERFGLQWAVLEWDTLVLDPSFWSLPVYTLRVSLRFTSWGDSSFHVLDLRTLIFIKSSLLWNIIYSWERRNESYSLLLGTWQYLFWSENQHIISKWWTWTVHHKYCKQVGTARGQAFSYNLARPSWLWAMMPAVRARDGHGAALCEHLQKNSLGCRWPGLQPSLLWMEMEKHCSKRQQLFLRVLFYLNFFIYGKWVLLSHKESLKNHYKNIS